MKHGKKSDHFLKGWRFRILIAVMVLSGGGYLLFMVWNGWSESVAALRLIGVGGGLTALTCSLVNYGLRFVRWQGFLSSLVFHIPLWKSLKIYLSGFALTTTPAKAGEMLRSVFLKDLGINYHASFGVFFAERLSDLISVLLLAAIGLWEYPSARGLCVSTGIIIIIVLFVIQRLDWMRSLQRWAQFNLSRKSSRAIAFFVKMLVSFRACFSLRSLGKGSFLGLAAWGAECAAFYFILFLLDAGVPFLSAVFIYAFSMLVGALTLLPGGLGGTEVTMLQLLLWYGVAATDAAVATVVIRLSTLWFAVALGLLTLPFMPVDCGQLSGDDRQLR